MTPKGQKTHGKNSKTVSAKVLKTFLRTLNTFSLFFTNMFLSSFETMFFDLKIVIFRGPRYPFWTHEIPSFSRSWGYTQDGCISPWDPRSRGPDPSGDTPFWVDLHDPVLGRQKGSKKVVILDPWIMTQKCLKNARKNSKTVCAKVLKTFLRTLNTFSTLFTFFVFLTSKKHVFWH